MSNIQASIALTQSEQTYRSEIIEGLRCGICTVIFTKTDGTERTMRCTLAQSFLPKKEYVKADIADLRITPMRKPKPESIISVWDLEKKAWRSFSIRTVIKWKQDVLSQPVSVSQLDSSATDL
jgi:hypothetical protein